MQTLYGVSPEDVKLVEDRENGRLVVNTRFYEVAHDLRQGGAIAAIRYYNGSNRNILLQPMGSFLNLPDAWGFSDLNEHEPQVSASAAPGPTLRFSGLLRNGEGKDAGVRYESEYQYRWGYVKVFKRFTFPASGLAVRQLCVHRYVLQGTLSDWGYRPAPETEPSCSPFHFCVYQWGKARPGTHFDCPLETRFIPLAFVNAEAGREGLEWFVSSKLSEWNYQTTGRAGCGSFHISARADLDGVEVGVSPLHVPCGAATLRGSYDFHFYHGFPILSGRAHQPFVHASFNRHDWPSDEQIRQWAEGGIRTAHFHHDGDSFGDGLFWRDGRYPPFGPEDMAQYDRVIAACRKHGIRTATYFSNKELHPTTEAYQKHGEEWGRKPTDTGRLAHNYYKNDEYGAQMCLRSGWLDYLEQYIDTVLSHHALDGVYYDWNVGLYCQNPLHADPADRARAIPSSESGLGAGAFSPAGHWDMDELLDLMEWTRRRVGPEGLVIVHNTMVPCAAVENFADYVVAMEWGYGRLSKSVPRPDELPLEWNFLGARSRGVIGYGTLLPNSPKSLERRMTLVCLVTGVVPWTASPITLEIFRPLRGLDLSDYRFYDWRNSVVQLDPPSLVSCAYAKRGHALVLLANLSSKPVSVRCRLALEALGLPPTAVCRVLPVAEAATAGKQLHAAKPFAFTVDADGLVALDVR